MEIIKHRNIFTLLIFVFCIIFGVFIVIRSNNIPQVDNPIVSYSNTEIPTIKTDFLYSDVFKRKHNFHIDFNNEVNNINPIMVLPSKELKIIFKYKPLSYMLVRQLDNGNYENIFYSNEGDSETAITTPKEPGKYVYGISANYPEGLGLYYFSIEVNQELK